MVSGRIGILMDRNVVQLSSSYSRTISLPEILKYTNLRDRFVYGADFAKRGIVVVGMRPKEEEYRRLFDRLSVSDPGMVKFCDIFNFILAGVEPKTGLDASGRPALLGVDILAEKFSFSDNVDNVERRHYIERIIEERKRDCNALLVDCDSNLDEVVNKIASMAGLNYGYNNGLELK